MFVALMMSLEHQLHMEYHRDSQLRDRLQSAINIPTIKDEIKDPTPRMSHKFINRVSNLLSTSNRTVGPVSALVVAHELESDLMDDYEGDGHYTLGQSCGGDAKCNIQHTGQGEGHGEAAGEEDSYITPAAG